MNQGVPIQITITKKGFFAQKASVSFVSTVKQFVFGKVSFPRKCLWTFVTSIVKYHLISEFKSFIFSSSNFLKSPNITGTLSDDKISKPITFPFTDACTALTPGKEAE